MSKIKVPFSKQIYDPESDKVHNIRIVENSEGTRKQRKKFRYILQIGYRDPVVMKLETLPENEEQIKDLMDLCLKHATEKVSENEISFC